MVIQWRPKAGETPSRQFYSVARDIGHIGPDLLTAFGHALEETWWEPWFRDYMEEKGLTYEDLVDPARKFLAACLQIIKVANPTEALAASGFDKVDPTIQAAFYTKLGQVFLAAVWAGVKDLARPDSDPPVTFDEMMRDIDARYEELLVQRRHESHE